MSRGEQLAYLEQTYHLVCESIALMRDAKARLPGRQQLIEALDTYISGEAGHEQAILDEMAAAGGDLPRIKAGKPAAATVAMIDCARAAIRKSDPIAIFGMVYVMECVGIASIHAGAEAARTALELDEMAFGRLVAQGEIEDQARFFTGLMAQIDDPADQRAIIDTACDIFCLFGAVFAGLSGKAPAPG